MAHNKKAEKEPAKPPKDYYSKVAEKYRDVIEFVDPEDQGPRADVVTTTFIRQELLIEIYLACLGNVETACRIAKVGRRTFYRWIRQPEFTARLNEAMLEWELRLHNRSMELAMQGDRIMLIFLLKFLNPYYDDGFRARMVAPIVGDSLYERHPIPNPELLPPEIPERFGNAQGVQSADGDTGTDKD